MYRITSLLLGLFLVACEDKEGPIDLDGDGFDEEVDCVDENPAINPDASDSVGDDIDQNCDGTDGIDSDEDGIASISSGGTDCDDSDADEAISTGSAYYSDSDGDGFGNVEQSLTACEQPIGFVEDNSDCDDSNSRVFPNAPEVCDGLDNDCDEAIDGDDSSVEGLITVYADSDGDGFGDALSETEVCELADGLVEDSSDCNDSDDQIHPRAEEVLGDGIDNDCDSHELCYEDLDDDNFGSENHVLLFTDASAIAECDLAANASLNSSDCDDSSDLINPDAQEVCDSGVDNDCDGLSDDDDDSTDLTTGSSFYADLDLDGFGDANNSVMACVQTATMTTNAGDCDDSLITSHPMANDIYGDNIDQNCDGIDGIDVDQDGYAAVSSGGTDCDDFDALINPDAQEICDSGVDNDCDGLSDDDDISLDLSATAPLYLDADGDGFGDVNNFFNSCHSGATGYVVDNTDCNDENGSANPAASEVCDEVDNNCDGDIDEGVLISFYLDTDNDGYGNSSLSIEACEQPIGYSDLDGDCDDLEPLANPNEVEVCDGIDNNCDTYVDEGLLESLYADLDGDGFGDPAAGMMVCPDEEGYVSDSTDCDDASNLTFPGAAERESSSDCMADLDGDGFGDSSAGGSVVAGLDCDDNLASYNPLVTDILGDGYDQNCDNLDGTDSDGDGDASIASGGTDCDDSDAGLESFDADTDGVSTCDGDCDDSDPNVQGDLDGDGYSGCIDDCDDSDPAIYPEAIETYYDGVDSDCAGNADEFDQDGDGEIIAELDCDGDGNFDAMCDFDGDGSYDYIAGTDCDDTDANLNSVDLDGDGYSSCDGDCWDDDVEDANGDGVLDSSLAYPGAAFNDSATECLLDEDGDGYASGVQGCFQIDMTDGFGDGWTNNYLNFYEDGFLATSITLSGGSSGSETFCPQPDTATLDIYFATGSFTAEIGFEILDSNGSSLGTGAGVSNSAIEFNGVTVNNGELVLSQSLGGSDCDDSDAAINPDAVEVCEDGVDNNCSGSDASCITASCLELYQQGTTVDDVYTIEVSGNEIDVYCDMTNGGWTYEDFGFGGVVNTYAGWEVMEWTDFQDQQVAEALSYFYNLHGLTNIHPGWTSSNCCITSPNLNRKYGFDSQIFMFPSNGGSSSQCGGSYASQMYVWGGMGHGTFYTLSAQQIMDVNDYGGCGGNINNNPGIFVKRWQ